MKTIIGLFDNLDDARSAIEDLKSLQATNISYATSKKDWFDRNKEIKVTTDDADVPDLGTATVTGAGIGVLAGLIISTLAIPGFGPLFVAGPILGLLGGGAVIGGIVGALAGWGVAESEATVYADKIKAGSAMVAADITNADEQKAIDALSAHSGEDIRVYENAQDD